MGQGIGGRDFSPPTSKQAENQWKKRRHCRIDIEPKGYQIESDNNGVIAVVAVVAIVRDDSVQNEYLLDATMAAT